MALFLSVSVTRQSYIEMAKYIKLPFWQRGSLRLTQYYTHPFNGPFSRTTQVSRYQKGKTNLDFTEARDSEWQWHQLEHMQVCTSLQTDNHANTPPFSVAAQLGAVGAVTENLQTDFLKNELLNKILSRLANCIRLSQLHSHHQIQTYQKPLWHGIWKSML